MCGLSLVVSLASNCQKIAKSEGLLWKDSLEVIVNVLSVSVNIFFSSLTAR